MREDLLQLEYGNKIAILGGDYLLANACTGLADLRNTYIVEMISIAIAEFTQVLLCTMGARIPSAFGFRMVESCSVVEWFCIGMAS